MLHLVFKVSSTCSHTRLKSLSPLSNCYQLCAGQACSMPQQYGVGDPGVKVNGQYYQDILLTRDLLPDITQYSDYFTFQQDRTPSHRARETVELLKVETPDFIPPNLWPPNSPNLNPVDYKIWGIGLLQERVHKTSSKDVDELRRRHRAKVTVGAYMWACELPVVVLA